MTRDEAADWVNSCASNLVTYHMLAKRDVPRGWPRFDEEMAEMKEAIAAYEAAKREAP